MQVTKEDVLRCQIQEWYPHFRNYTYETHFVGPLPRDLIEDGLLSDKIDYFVPLSEEQKNMRKRRCNSFHSWSSDSSGWDYGDNDDTMQHDVTDRQYDSESESEEEKHRPSSPPRQKFRDRFPELHAEISEKLRLLHGGSAFPKLNWSSPQDAKWMAEARTLNCETPEEIFQLLHASDYIVHDLCHAFDDCDDREGDLMVGNNEPGSNLLSCVSYHLALREFEQDMSVGMEFRCFVRDRQLIGISQRDISSYYDFIAPLKNDIKEALSNFINTTLCVHEKMPGFENYVVDVYIKRSQSGRMEPKLLDFSPFCSSTNPGLFRWEELTGEDGAMDAIIEDEPISNSRTDSDREFRFVTSEANVKQKTDRYNTMPVDLWEFTHQPDQMLRAIQKIEKKQR